MNCHFWKAAVQTMQYTAEVKHLFAEPKYATMEELLQIRKNAGKKRARKT